MEFQPMSPEDVERTMQFLLRSQAQFEANFARASQKTEADFARLSEGLIGLTALHNLTERKVRQLVDSMGAVREGTVALDGIVGRMSERIDKVGERVDARLDRLEKSQEHTDRQIKEIASHFGRHLRRNHRRKTS